MIIDRTGADSLIPQEEANTIIQGATETSAVLRLGRRLPDMNNRTRRLPVLTALPSAYFVTGDTGLKQTTNAAWQNKFLNAEEIAVIVPIPEAVLDDSDYDIFGQVKPLIVEAIGRTIDRAVIHGENRPADWPEGLVPQTVTAGNTVTLGTGTDLYDDIMGVNGVIARVEEDGFMVNGHVAAMSMRGRLRGLRDANGQPIFTATMQENRRYALDGDPMEFPLNDGMDPARALMVSGDFSNLVYAIRQDITWKLLDQAVIQNPDGSILYNLAQQDMVALRCVIRLAWQIPNPLNRVNGTGTRFPFAALRPVGAV